MKYSFWICAGHISKRREDFTVETMDSVPAALKMYLKIVLQMFFNTLLESYVSVVDLIQ
jgi:hypothetical protein